MSLDAESNPNLQLKNKLMKGVYNPIDKIQQNVAKQIKGNKKDLKMQVPFGLSESSKKNFHKIFNWMKKGDAALKNSSIHDSRKEMGNLKEMGKMKQHRNPTAKVRKTETKVGNLNSLQLDSGEHVNLGSVEKAVGDEVGETANAKEYEEALATISAQNTENQELLKSIDIDGMIKKY